MCMSTYIDSPGRKQQIYGGQLKTKIMNDQKFRIKVTLKTVIHYPQEKFYEMFWKKMVPDLPIKRK